MEYRQAAYPCFCVHLRLKPQVGGEKCTVEQCSTNLKCIAVVEVHSSPHNELWCCTGSIDCRSEARSKNSGVHYWNALPHVHPGFCIPGCPGSSASTRGGNHQAHRLPRLCRNFSSHYGAPCLLTVLLLIFDKFDHSAKILLSTKSKDTFIRVNLGVHESPCVELCESSEGELYWQPHIV